MTWKCNICGTENEDEDEFCVLCGSAKVDDVEKHDQILDQPQTEESSESMETDEEMNEPPVEDISQNDKVENDTEEDEAHVNEAEPQKQSEEEYASEEKEPEMGHNESEAEEKEPEMEHFEVKMEGEAVNGQPSFIIVNSPDQRFVKSKIPLEFDVFNEITIGRSPENIIVVPDADVSKKHAVVSLNNNIVEIEDLGSTNGTFVYDGKFIKINGKTPLRNNTLIRFGYSTMFKLVFD